MSALSIIITLCIVMVSITIHEFGHFIAAKLFNFAISEFSIGIGPKLFQVKKNNILYSLRLLPLGGYLNFYEDPEKYLPLNPAPDKENAVLKNKFITIEISSEEQKKLEQSFEEEKRQYKEAIKGKRIISEASFSKFVVLIMGVTFNFILCVICITIVANMMGYNFFDSIAVSLNAIYSSLLNLFGSNKILDANTYGSVVAYADIVNDLTTASQSNKELISNLLYNVASLNLGLAIINLIPLPILDGGQIVINTIELIMRKPISPKAKIPLNVLTWLLVMSFGIFLIVRDIIRL